MFTFPHGQTGAIQAVNRAFLMKVELIMEVAAVGRPAGRGGTEGRQAWPTGAGGQTRRGSTGYQAASWPERGGEAAGLAGERKADPPRTDGIPGRSASRGGPEGRRAWPGNGRQTCRGPMGAG